MRLLSLLLCVALLPAPALTWAQDKNTSREIKVDTPLPPAPGERGKITTDISPQRPPILEKPAVTGPGGVSGLPPIPAAGGSSSTSVSPVSPASAPAPTATASTPSLAGVPLKAYETLAQAAADGVDPLGERKQEPVKVSAPEPVKPAFDWKNWRSYWDWIQANQAVAIKYAVAILVAFIAARLFMARRQKEPVEE